MFEIAFVAGSFLQCSQCSSDVSYEDCQNQATVANCTNVEPACFQTDIQLEKGSDKQHLFSKGCLQKKDCENYNKGQIEFCTVKETQGYTVECKGKCCLEDECNKGNILVMTKPVTGMFTLSQYLLINIVTTFF